MVCLAVGCIMAAAPARAAQQNEALTYEMRIAGVDGALRTLLERASTLRRNAGTPPRSHGALQSRIDEDLKTLTRVLRSQGYYDSRISYSLDSAQKPLGVTLNVLPGPHYMIGDIQIDITDSSPPGEVMASLRDAMALKAGAPLRAADVIAAERHILTALTRTGYPQVRTGPRLVAIDHETRSAEVVYRFTAGPRLVFDETVYRGADSVKRGYLDKLKTWTEGEVVDQTQLDAFRRRLMQTRLMNAVRIDVVPLDRSETEGDEATPARILIALTEAPLRTISVGAGFSTTEGIGADVSWEHRNLLGAHERLTLTATGSELEQSLRADFYKPHFRRPDQALTATTRAVRQDTDAFDSLELGAGVGLDRRLSNHWTLGVSLDASISEIDDADGKRTFLIGSLPVAANYDSRDNILDPTEGWFLRLATTPSLAEQSGSFVFLRNEGELRSYQQLDERGRIILAERVTAGSIIGADRARVPASRRFFSGGGGSVRSVGFQKAGPLDDVGDPLGGRSLFETSLEFRWRVTETIGIVPFFEGGRVWEDKTPQFSDIRWGAGLGLRYHTSFAPIRVDVAFPINRRPGIDDRVQFFISLGQSF